MPPRPLTGQVAVVPVHWSSAGDLARRLSAEGATVVLVGDDAEAAGRMAAAVEAMGAGRPAVFVTAGAGGDLDALVGFLVELFEPRSR